ncbi:hypothetical protein ACFVUS_12410 [Nocardia sp. NPDC058058]|uniref:hypothetical protein n=1 Tax=Nocardia sp. NPDC058058 TaxID=3346317 RepID=UPI0036DF5844
MLGIPIENHEAVTAMSLSYARGVVRVHQCCSILACPKKRQAVAKLIAARKAIAGMYAVQQNPRPTEMR